MRIVVAGATGVIGIRVVPLLVKAGHDVLGMTRTPGNTALLQDLGATGLVCDVYDAAELRRIVVEFAPDAVLHELTDLTDDPAEIDEAANARMRTEGTANILAAARAAGSPWLLAQSVAWPLEGVGGEAVAWHEAAVLAYGGVVARYGQLYGPGTYFPESLPEHPRIQIDTAAERTVALLGSPAGTVVLID